MLWLYSIGRWHGCCPIRVLPATTILLWIKWLRAFWSSDFVSPVLLKAPANGSMAICGGGPNQGVSLARQSFRDLSYARFKAGRLLGVGETPSAMRRCNLGGQLYGVAG